VVYLRKGNNPANDILVVLNMTPVVRYNQRTAVPAAGKWKQIFNTDEEKYWGSGITNAKAIKSEKEAWQGKDNSILITLPPLSVVMFKREG
jgi:1,4-alpha-glucan branching enzyme